MKIGSNLNAFHISAFRLACKLLELNLLRPSQWIWNGNRKNVLQLYARKTAVTCCFEHDVEIFLKICSWKIQFKHFFQLKISLNSLLNSNTVVQHEKY